jgi:hypothetical protein
MTVAITAVYDLRSIGAPPRCGGLPRRARDLPDIAPAIERALHAWGQEPLEGWR